jgi:hypothetical protein
MRQGFMVEYEVDGLEESLDDLRNLSRLAKAKFGPRHVVDNLESVEEWYQDRIPDRLIWTVSIVNDTEYARYLHDRTGYWVMNDSAALNTLQARIEDLAEEIADGAPVTDEAIEETLTAAAEDIIDYYTEVEGRKMKDGREMTAPRPKHRGEWADDTVTLVRNFVAYLGGDRDSPETSGQEVASSEDYTPPFGGE